MNSLFLPTLLGLTAVFAAADTPFNGKDLSNWETKKEAKGKPGWVVGTPSVDPESPKRLIAASGTAAMINDVSGHAQSWDIYTKEKWGGKFRLEIELMVPQGSNSGVYVMGEYEVQVLDSWGKPDDKLSAGDIGAIYSAAVPKVNAAKKPGEWQKFVIDFEAPRFDATGKKSANAKFVKVELNGKTLHENVEMKGPTPGGVSGQEHAEGPLMLQGNHGAVAFRNIKITALK
ncbi:MAG: 3-keto-disaccharide hydrolase [Verrucomicrobiales bacterium]